VGGTALLCQGRQVWLGPGPRAEGGSRCPEAQAKLRQSLRQRTTRVVQRGGLRSGMAGQGWSAEGKGQPSEASFPASCMTRLAELISVSGAAGPGAAAPRPASCTEIDLLLPTGPSGTPLPQGPWKRAPTAGAEEGGAPLGAQGLLAEESRTPQLWLCRRHETHPGPVAELMYSGTMLYCTVHRDILFGPLAALSWLLLHWRCSYLLSGQQASDNNHALGAYLGH